MSASFSSSFFISPIVYGGGVCQVSTTLYNAVLSLPLKIEAWSIHRYTGVSYVPQFFDAAVGRYSDLRFTNTLPYSICVLASAENGIRIIYVRAYSMFLIITYSLYILLRSSCRLKSIPLRLPFFSVSDKLAELLCAEDQQHLFS